MPVGNGPLAGWWQLLTRLLSRGVYSVQLLLQRVTCSAIVPPTQQSLEAQMDGRVDTIWLLF